MKKVINIFIITILSLFWLSYPVNAMDEFNNEEFNVNYTDNYVEEQKPSKMEKFIKGYKIFTNALYRGASSYSNSMNQLYNSTYGNSSTTYCNSIGNTVRCSTYGY